MISKGLGRHMSTSIGLAIADVFSRLTERIHSAEFFADARHPEFPKAFTRTNKLPLPKLIGALLSMRASSQQVMLDAFYGSLSADGDWSLVQRGMSLNGACISTQE